MPRFAANLGFLFPEHDFLDRFARARDSGFQAVEFAIPYLYEPHVLAAKLRENGLACVLMNLPMGERARGDYGLACRPERRDEFRAGVAHAIEYARALGCPRMNCLAGLARPGEDRAVLRETAISNMRFAAAEFKRAGLEILMEPLNDREVPGFLVPRARDVVGLLREIDAGNAFLQLDLYHAAMMGDDPALLLRELEPWIRHIQFADAPGRGEPGTGVIPLRDLFRDIDASGFEGWVAAEYRPTRRTEDTLSTFLS
ncbi:MAG TPA: TIM barrel protein [Usitatibacter sp.]|jgi:hydroxypyruvate isomerase|nr:TIM barrel protein [Usitatibacter sp.]